METTPEFSSAVRTLLNRMDSHPKEFAANKGGRWLWVLRDVEARVIIKHQTTETTRLPLPFLSNDEVNALYDKWMLLQREAFEHRVMQEMLSDPTEGGPFNAAILEGMKNLYPLPNNVSPNPYGLPQELIDQYRAYSQISTGLSGTGLDSSLGALGGIAPPPPLKR